MTETAERRDHSELHSEHLAKIGLVAKDLPALQAAAALSQTAIHNARAALTSDPHLDAKTDIVGFGSLARFELTENSDFDYLQITEDQKPDLIDPSVIDHLRSSMLDGAELDEPGTSGLFAQSIAVDDLVTNIGLERDTNESLSRRILFLEESVSLAHQDVHQRAVRRILQQYLNTNRDSAQIPRFLINDIIRYWRTITIDFQAKANGDAPKALRYLKLLTSRKLCYVASLGPLWLLQRSGLDHPDEKLDFLSDQFSRPAAYRLTQLLSEVCDIDAGAEEHARNILQTLDHFVECSGNAEWRMAVELEAFGESPKVSPHYGAMRDCGKELHQSLVSVFTGPALQDFTHEFLLM